MILRVTTTTAGGGASLDNFLNDENLANYYIVPFARSIRKRVGGPYAQDLGSYHLMAFSHALNTKETTFGRTNDML
jgi:hypothetical protein